MNQFLPILYKNNALLYKVFLFIVTTVFLVYLFPKSGSFRYSFENGKPWQSENLYAPFDFAIEKSKTELQLEKERIIEDSPVFFDVDTTRFQSIKNNYNLAFERDFFEVSNNQQKLELYAVGLLIIEKIYQVGLLDENYGYDPKQVITVLINKTQDRIVNYEEFLPQSELNNFVETLLKNNINESYWKTFKSIFFDLVVPNATFNASLTEVALDERLSQMSLVRGRVDKGTLIISKGEVVQGDKLAMLKSLESEYESQVWSESNYVWILAAYSVLVALALLMLFLFLRMYRPEIFLNNTKVTFIF